MSLKSIIVRRVIPQRMYRVLERRRNVRGLRREPPRSLDQTDTAAFLNVRDLGLDDIFENSDCVVQWQESSARLDTISISASAGGVNPGDRRALYQLISHMQPSRVLEVGTHIGASTVYLADAMRHYADEGQEHGDNLVTVDIIDVNHQQERPWERSGEIDSPKVKLQKLGLDGLVEFVAMPSLHYLQDTEKKFDLVFLDGDHSAGTVYKELPAALERLNRGGCVVLHDFFPGGEPLWSNGAVVSGPYLAVERLLEEGLNIRVRPLGELPWECKLGSRVTSLALVGQ